MAGAPKPDHELQRICGAIATARQNLNDDARFDVSPLTASLDSVCEQIAAMPHDMAKGYIAPLQATLKLLEALEDDIRTAHGALRQRMSAIGGTDATAEAGEESID